MTGALNMTIPNLGDAGPGWATNVRTALQNIEKAAVFSIQARGGDPTMTVDSTSVIYDTIDEAPAGSIIDFGLGRYLTDPIVAEKMLIFAGGGRFRSWLRPRLSISEPLIRFDLPAGSATNWAHYGHGVKGLGMDLYGAPAATGIDSGTTSSWMRVEDFYCQGGAVSIRNRSGNNWIEDCVLVDATKPLDIDGDTGLELTLRDIAIGRNSPGTTTRVIDIVCANTNPKGALWMSNVRSTSGTSGGVSTTAGMRMTAPGNVSVPLFAERVTLDNIAGPGLELVNVGDIHFDNGWINSAAGGSCVKMTGGFNLNFRGNDYFPGPFGSAKTYEFVGGATNGFTSIGNFCPGDVIYHLPLTGKPLNMHCHDRSVHPVKMDWSNDMAGFRAAQARRTGLDFLDHQLTLATPPQFNEANGLSGFAVLVPGGGGADASVTVPCTAVDSVRSIIHTSHRNIDGTPGTLYIAGITTGVGFTIGSTSTSDAAIVEWIMVYRG